MQEFSARLEARGITAGVWERTDDGKGDRGLELEVTLLASTSEEARERVTDALMTETPPGWSVDWSVRLGVSTGARARAERVNRLRQDLPPALTLLWSGGGVFDLHDADVLALVVDDAGQLVLRLRFSVPWDYDVELTIGYTHARLIGITDDEREEIFDPDRKVAGDERDGVIVPGGPAIVEGDELDTSGDGRFVHRFWLSRPWKTEFAIEFDDAAMSLHLRVVVVTQGASWSPLFNAQIPDHVVDLGQPDAIAALQETVALLRQRAGAPVGAGFAWWLNDLSRRLARASWPEEALAASEEASAVDP